MSLSTDIRAFVWEQPSTGTWRWELDGPEHSLRVARNVTGPGGSAQRHEHPAFLTGASAPDKGTAQEQAILNRDIVIDVLEEYNAEQQADQLARDNREEVLG